MPHYFSIEPGMEATVVANFHNNESRRENQFILWDPNGQKVFNPIEPNPDGRSRIYVIPRNTGPTPQLYKIEGEHKNTGPDAGQPWHASWERVISQTADSLVMGYEDTDAVNGDYNDAMATITFRTI